MIQPINGHLLIEPLKHEEFIASERDTYDEVAVVKAVAEGVTIPVGATVYFDSYMAKKYRPLNVGEPDIWLLHQDEVVGLINAVQEIPE